MKIGYPCLGVNLPWRSTKTFRLASYTDERLHQTVASNIEGLGKILEFNKEHSLLFYRIGSEMVPFASHPVCTYPWQNAFRLDFRAVGRYIRENGFRISMHPDQFVLINSPSEDIWQRSVAELQYQCEVLDLMGLDSTAKLQLHVGGVYGSKPDSIARFIERHRLLDENIRQRLVIENDDRLYTVADCLQIHRETGIPILFDNFHHLLNNNGETEREAFLTCAATWDPERDGILMMDYSSQAEGERVGKHRADIDLDDFHRFLNEIEGLDCDIMLELKNKEECALPALQVLQERRLVA